MTSLLKRADRFSAAAKKSDPVTARPHHRHCSEVYPSVEEEKKHLILSFDKVAN